MPRRTNLFQRVIFVVQQHLAEGSTVTESAMLTDATTGELREVDILIEGRLPGVPVDVAVAIECRDHNRPQTVTWIEEATAKHDHLRTTNLILASSSGFTRSAEKKADFLNVTLWAPGKIDFDVSREIVGRLNSLWQKVFTYNPAEFRIGATFEVEDGSTVSSADLASPLSGMLTDHDGNPVGTIYSLISDVINRNQGDEAFRDVLTGRYQMEFSVNNFGVSRAGGTASVYTHIDGQPERRMRFKSITVSVPVEFVVTEIPLEHRKMADQAYSYGSSHVGGNESVVVVTEPTGQPPRISLYPNPFASGRVAG